MIVCGDYRILRQYTTRKNDCYTMGAGTNYSGTYWTSHVSWGTTADGSEVARVSRVSKGVLCSEQVGWEVWGFVEHADIEQGLGSVGWVDFGDKENIQWPLPLSVPSWVPVTRLIDLLEDISSHISWQLTAVSVMLVEAIPPDPSLAVLLDNISLLIHWVVYHKI